MLAWSSFFVTRGRCQVFEAAISDMLPELVFSELDEETPVLSGLPILAPSLAFKLSFLRIQKLTSPTNLFELFRS